MKEEEEEDFMSITCFSSRILFFLEGLEEGDGVEIMAGGMEKEVEEGKLEQLDEIMAVVEETERFGREIE